MKNISTGLLQHLAGECLTLATLWKVERQDGQIYAFTDHDVNIDYEGTTYLASSGFTPSSIDNNSDLAVDNLDLDGILVSETITDEDLKAGRWDFAKVTVLRVNYESLIDGHIVLKSGRLGEVTTARSSYKSEIRGLTQNLQQTVGRIYQPACDADLGDNRCKVNLANFTFELEVVEVLNSHTIRVSVLTSPPQFEGQPPVDDFLTHGLATVLTGEQAGVQKEVRSQKGDLIYLSEDLVKPLLVGDTLSIYAGCNKTRKTCFNKFQNVINFRGFPDLPGRDKIVSPQKGGGEIPQQPNVSK